MKSYTISLVLVSLALNFSVAVDQSLSCTRVLPRASIGDIGDHRMNYDPTWWTEQNTGNTVETCILAGCRPTCPSNKYPFAIQLSNKAGSNNFVVCTDNPRTCSSSGEQCTSPRTRCTVKVGGVDGCYCVLESGGQCQNRGC